MAYVVTEVDRATRCIRGWEVLWDRNTEQLQEIWARYHLRPVRLPRRLRHLAADCGGFVATRIWGDYRFSPTQ